MNKSTVPDFTSTSTIHEVREYFSETIRQGKSAFCPCCDRIVKVYKRTVTSSMAYGLIMVRNYWGLLGPGFPWFHMENFFKDLDIPNSIRGDMPKWVLWECLEKATGEKDDGNPNNGMYRLTMRGLEFVHDKIKMRKYVRVYNNVTYGFDGPLVSIKEALKDKFNYEELMHR